MSLHAHRQPTGWYYVKYPTGRDGPPMCEVMARTYATAYHGTVHRHSSHPWERFKTWLKRMVT